MVMVMVVVMVMVDGTDVVGSDQPMSRSRSNKPTALPKTQISITLG